MFGFLVKKSFFDLWDSMIYIFLMNVLTLVLFFGGVAVLSFLPPTVGVFLIVALGIGTSILVGAVSYLCGELAFGRRPGFREIGTFFGLSWKPSLLYSGIMGVIMMFIFIGYPFYLNMGIVGVVILSLMFWFILITLLSLQFYFPLGKQLRNPPLKILRKSYIILLDNTLTAILMGVVSLIPLAGLWFIPTFGTSGLWGILLSLCGLFFLFFPGIGGLLLFQQNGLKLIMKKYDYMETHPEVTKKELDWDELLQEERETLGHRTLKNLLFPWKD